jgi:hypothetical protein
MRPSLPRQVPRIGTSEPFRRRSDARRNRLVARSIDRCMTTSTLPPRRGPLATLLRATAFAGLAIGPMGAQCDTGRNVEDDEVGSSDPTTTVGAEPTSDAPTSTGDDPPPTTTTAPTTTTTAPDPDTTQGDPTTGGPGGGCLASGTYVVALTSLDDPYGHLPFLKLFYEPDAPEQTVDEEAEFFVLGEVVTLSFTVRQSSEFEGHDGLADLAGTIDGDCNVAISTSAPFVAGGSPFGTIDVAFSGVMGDIAAGESAGGSLTLEGGNIPNGPISYTITFE